MDNSLNSNALVSLEEVREALMLEDTEVKDDNFLIRLINRKSSRIATYCKRVFYPAQEFTEYYDGDAEKGIVIINNPPIISVQGLWDDPNVSYDSNTIILAQNYVFEAEEGTVRLLKFLSSERFFSRGNQNIKVVYSGGYFDSTLPDDLKDACINWVATDYRRFKDKHHGYLSKSATGGSVSLDTKAMPDVVKDLLSGYRHFSFGRE